MHKTLHDELDNVLIWLADSDEGWNHAMMNVPTHKIQGRSNFAGYVDYHWVYTHDSNKANMAAGPKETCRRIFKHTGDKMMYIVWLAAAIKTIEDTDRRIAEDWCGEPFMFLRGISRAIHERYPGEFGYHTSCTNVFPEDMRIHMFKPATHAHDLANIVSNMSIFTRLAWMPIKFVFDK